MLELYERIAQADELAIEELLKAVLRRCAELFPDKEISLISLPKSFDQNEQLDRIIEQLQNMKAFS